ncbi:aldedh domain-containing protein, partial [Haematococcus lacustris]
MAQIYSEIRAESGAFKYLCNGQWRESSSGKVVANVNPCTRETAYTMQACTQGEVEEVFAAAKAAQKEWARTPLYKRSQVLHRVATIMREHAQPIADCLVVEVAKPARDSLSEVIRSADLLEYTAEEGVRVLGEGKLLTSDSF